MTYPLWSGINSHAIDATDINGAAPTPAIIVDGFSSAIIPVLIGSFPNLYFEVLYARPERRSARPIHETRHTQVNAEKRVLRALPMVRVAGSDRSHKHYPHRRVK